MKNKNEYNKGCHWLLWVIAIIVIWAFFSSNHKDNAPSPKSSASNNNIKNSTVSSASKPSSPTSTKISVANVTVLPTSTPVPTPKYIVYNSKDLINGAPFYSKPNNVQDFWIRSLRNETQIEIIGEMESHNNFDWYPIRDDQGRAGWIQAIYVSDTNHVVIKPSNVNKSGPAKTAVPTKKPASTNTPVPTRKPAPTPFRTTWKCYDVTSIDYNWNNDNKCISNTNEVRYAGDAEAMRLDPTYHPR